MLVPTLLGYLVGSVGIYFLLYKVSPVVTEDHVARFDAPEGDGQVDIIELFQSGQTAEQAKAA